MSPLVIFAGGILVGFVVGTIFWAIWSCREMKP